MTLDLTGSQRRLLVKMMFSGEEPKLSDYANKGGQRDHLVKLGLVRTERQGLAQRLVLTDKAWSEASRVIEQELSGKGVRKDLAYHLLAKVYEYGKVHQVAMQDFLRPPPPAATRLEVTAQIRSTYLSLTGGRFHKRVRLADLRDSLPHVGRPELEAALRDLMDGGRAHLLPLDDPSDRKPRDEAAAMKVGGKARHLLSLESA